MSNQKLAYIFIVLVLSSMFFVSYATTSNFGITGLAVEDSAPESSWLSNFLNSIFGSQGIEKPITVPTKPLVPNPGLEKVIDDAADTAGVDPLHLFVVGEAESGYDTNKLIGDEGNSVGFWHVNIDTAKNINNEQNNFFGFSGKNDDEIKKDLGKTDTNALIAALFIKKIYETDDYQTVFYQGDQTDRTIAATVAYNRGTSNVPTLSEIRSARRTNDYTTLYSGAQGISSQAAQTRIETTLRAKNDYYYFNNLKEYEPASLLDKTWSLLNPDSAYAYGLTGNRPGADIINQEIASTGETDTKKLVYVAEFFKGNDQLEAGTIDWDKWYLAPSKEDPTKNILRYQTENDLGPVVYDQGSQALSFDLGGEMLDYFETNSDHDIRAAILYKDEAGNTQQLDARVDNDGRVTFIDDVIGSVFDPVVGLKDGDKAWDVLLIDQDASDAEKVQMASQKSTNFRDQDFFTVTPELQQGYIDLNAYSLETNLPPYDIGTAEGDMSWLIIMPEPYDGVGYTEDGGETITRAEELDLGYSPEGEDLGTIYALPNGAYAYVNDELGVVSEIPQEDLGFAEGDDSWLINMPEPALVDLGVAEGDDTWLINMPKERFTYAEGDDTWLINYPEYVVPEGDKGLEEALIESGDTQYGQATPTKEELAKQIEQRIITTQRSLPTNVRPTYTPTRTNFFVGLGSQLRCDDGAIGGGLSSNLGPISGFFEMIMKILGSETALFVLIFIAFFTLQYGIIASAMKFIPTFKGDPTISRQGKVVAISMAFITNFAIFGISNRYGGPAFILSRFLNTFELFGGILFGSVVFMIFYFGLGKPTESKSFATAMGATGVAFLLVSALMCKPTWFAWGLFLVAAALILVLLFGGFSFPGFGGGEGGSGGRDPSGKTGPRGPPGRDTRNERKDKDKIVTPPPSTDDGRLKIEVEVKDFTDESNPRGINEATVMLYRYDVEGTKKWAQIRVEKTEFEGNYVFKNVPRGFYFVKATAKNYSGFVERRDNSAYHYDPPHGNPQDAKKYFKVEESSVSGVVVPLRKTEISGVSIKGFVKDFSDPEVPIGVKGAKVRLYYVNEQNHLLKTVSGFDLPKTETSDDGSFTFKGDFPKNVKYRVGAEIKDYVSVDGKRKEGYSNDKGGVSPDDILLSGKGGFIGLSGKDFYGIIVPLKKAVAEKQVVIKGEVINLSNKKKGIDYAEVALFDANKNKIDDEVCDKKGRFSFEGRYATSSALYIGAYKDSYESTGSNRIEKFGLHNNPDGAPEKEIVFRADQDKINGVRVPLKLSDKTTPSQKTSPSTPTPPPRPEDINLEIRPVNNENDKFEVEKVQSKFGEIRYRNFKRLEKTKQSSSVELFFQVKVDQAFAGGKYKYRPYLMYKDAGGSFKEFSEDMYSSWDVKITTAKNNEEPADKYDFKREFRPRRKNPWVYSVMPRATKKFKPMQVIYTPPKEGVPDEILVSLNVLVVDKDDKAYDNKTAYYTIKLQDTKAKKIEFKEVEEDLKKAEEELIENLDIHIKVLDDHSDKGGEVPLLEFLGDIKQIIDNLTNNYKTFIIKYSEERLKALFNKTNTAFKKLNKSNTIERLINDLKAFVDNPKHADHKEALQKLVKSLKDEHDRIARLEGVIRVLEGLDGIQNFDQLKQNLDEAYKEFGELLKKEESVEEMIKTLNI
ncbi:hypothetical protein GOV05_00815 [Candidatus Woesearchaeota archaeon]|nr:hypothetical protein [Candidatus Woesearchaeota archaeon]